MSISESALLIAAGGTGALALAGAGVWRLGVEFEREWLRSLSAPPAPFEMAAYERMKTTVLTPKKQEESAPGAAGETASLQTA
ncbi:MAG TPA: hypothetical protein VGG08_02785 [Solirubrobacteraceae bacterium]